jgi:hypothetical protein
MIAPAALALRLRLFARTVPKWVLHAHAARFVWDPHTLLHGVIGAIEGLAREATPRTITSARKTRFGR